MFGANINGTFDKANSAVAISRTGFLPYLSLTGPESKAPTPRATCQ